MRYRNFIFDSARWDGFEHRPGDIIISTPPKCGTTWTQNIVAMLVFGTTTFDRPIAELSPWLDQTIHGLDATKADLAARDHRRFIKSHTPLDGLPWRDDTTYIAVARDPRDVAVSWDHHFQNLDLERVFALRAEAYGLDDLPELPPMPTPQEDPADRFWAYMTNRASERQFAGGLELLIIHLRSFWQRRLEPNVVMLHYADLERDLEGEMRRLAKRLGIVVPEDRWADLVEAASFRSMSSRPMELAPNAGAIWKDDGAFFHRGGSGQWQELVGEHAADRYHQIVRELTDDEEFLSWLHRP